MLTNTQIDKLIRKGLLDDVYKDVRRYGVITFDHEDISDCRITRTLVIQHQEREYLFELRRGEVVRVEY